MISLCGSPPADFILAFISGLILAVIILFVSHYKAYNSPNIIKMSMFIFPSLRK